MVPRHLVSRVIECMVEGERHRMRHLLRVMATCRDVKGVVLETPALWRHVVVPATGDVASKAVCRLLLAIPRNTVITLTANGPLPMHHAFLEALEAHGKSLCAVVCERQNDVTPVRGVVPRWRPSWSAATALTTLTLVVDVANSPKMPMLPPLRSLRSACIEVRHGTIGAIPSILGVQPVLARLRMRAERRDFRVPHGTPMPNLTPWLAQHPALQKLAMSFLQGNVHDVLRPVCVLLGVTELDLSVFETPMTYEFARVFPNVEQAAVHVHCRPVEVVIPPSVAPLLTWQHLRVASLKHVPLGPDGASLTQLTTLEKLHIERCRFTTLEALRPLTRLRYLCVRDPVASLEGVGTLTALTSLTVTSPVLEDAGDLCHLTRLRDITLDASQWFFPTPWHVPSFTATLESVWVSQYAATVMFEQTAAPMPALKTLYVYGGGADEVGQLMEHAARSPSLRRMRWTGVVTAAFARRYPRATAALAMPRKSKRRRADENTPPPNGEAVPPPNGEAVPPPNDEFTDENTPPPV